MKRGKKRRHFSTGHSKHQGAPVKDRRIVVVNDGPMRTRAARECDRAMAKLEKARAELRHFEQQDRPSFGRWMAATFGALMTEIRDNLQRVDEQEALIEEVELEMIWSNHRNPRKAYAAVMKRRENPGENNDLDDRGTMRNGASRPRNGAAGESRDARGAPNDDAQEDDGFDPFEEAGAEIPKEDRRALFEDLVWNILGVDPQQLDDAEYAKMFGEFEAEIFGQGPQPGPPQTQDAKMPSAGRDETRIKEIYRILVRRLHPDLRADGDATVSAIWHEVQAAYEGRNLDRLETLLALTEMESGANADRASLSQLRGALAELNRAFRAIQRSLGDAKRDPAWGFSRNPYHGPMEKRVRRDLEETLSQQQWALAELKRTLDEWSRPWHPPVKKPRPRSKPPENPKTERPQSQSSGPTLVQTEFFAF